MHFAGFVQVEESVKFPEIYFITMPNQQVCFLCSVFMGTIFLFVGPNVSANQIETCYSTKFPKSNMAYNTLGALFETNDLKNDGKYDAIKEEVRLFDWDELLRDVKPIIQKCRQGEARSFCGRG